MFLGVTGKRPDFKFVFLLIGRCAHIEEHSNRSQIVTVKPAIQAYAQAAIRLQIFNKTQLLSSK